MMSEQWNPTPASTNMHDSGFAPAQGCRAGSKLCGPDSETPEAVRAYAEKTIAQLRESYTQDSADNRRRDSRAGSIH